MHLLRLGSRISILDADVAPLRPTEPSQPLPQSGESRMPLRIGLAAAHQHANTPHSLWLLRSRHHRERNRRAAEQRDELAPSDHSITSSARASSVGGTSRPSALAVLRLISNSNFTGCCTGRSAGFSPLRRRPAYRPTRCSASPRLVP